MKVTNKLGLPEPVVAAVSNDPYDRGRCDYTVTQLIAPPRQVALLKEHSDEIETDAADRIFSLLGQAVHTILERAGVEGLREERLYITVKVNGKKIVVGGKYDYLVYADGILADYKVMSVWEYIFGVKDEKRWQLNMLAEILIQNGYPVNTLQIVAIFRDWSKRKAAFEKDYPPTQALIIPVGLFPSNQRLQLIADRVALHEAAKVSAPHCSNDERWSKPTTYAVVKDGRKSALRVLGKREDAEAWALAQGYASVDLDTSETVFDSGISIEVRPGENTRCEHYCDAAPFCEQWQKLKGN